MIRVRLSTEMVNNSGRVWITGCPLATVLE